MTDTELTTTELSAPMQALETEISALLKNVTERPVSSIFGEQVARETMKRFEDTAQKVELLARDHVDRAMATQRDALDFAESIRRMGALFCRRIEDETGRGTQVAMLMSEARKIIGNNAGS